MAKKVYSYLKMIARCLQEVFWLRYTVKFITLVIFFYFYFCPTVFLYHAASIRVIILSLDNQKCSACSHALSTVIARMYVHYYKKRLKGVWNLASYLFSFYSSWACKWSYVLKPWFNIVNTLFEPCYIRTYVTIF